MFHGEKLIPVLIYSGETHSHRLVLPTWLLCGISVDPSTSDATSVLYAHSLDARFVFRYALKCAYALRF